MQTEVIQRIKDQTRFSGVAKVTSRHHTPSAPAIAFLFFFLLTKSLGISRTYFGKSLMRPEIWGQESQKKTFGRVTFFSP